MNRLSKVIFVVACAVLLGGCGAPALFLYQATHNATNQSSQDKAASDNFEIIDGEYYYRCPDPSEEAGYYLTKGECDSRN